MPICFPNIFAIDIMKDSDDHNPGTFNAFALAGTQVGILVIALELLKGFLPVWLASHILYHDSQNDKEHKNTYIVTVGKHADNASLENLCHSSLKGKIGIEHSSH